MFGLDLRDIAGRVVGPAAVPGSYLDFVTLPGYQAGSHQEVLAVPVTRGEDSPGGMIRSRTVLLGRDGRVWLKYSANVNQPERVEELPSMNLALASWKAAELLQQVVDRVSQA